jgi:hypothetical protein
MNSDAAVAPASIALNEALALTPLRPTWITYCCPRTPMLEPTLETRRRAAIHPIADEIINTVRPSAAGAIDESSWPPLRTLIVAFKQLMLLPATVNEPRRDVVDKAAKCDDPARARPSVDHHIAERLLVPSAAEGVWPCPIADLLVRSVAPSSTLDEGVCSAARRAEAEAVVGQREDGRLPDAGGARSPEPAVIVRVPGRSGHCRMGAQLLQNAPALRRPGLRWRWRRLNAPPVS